MFIDETAAGEVALQATPKIETPQPDSLNVANPLTPSEFDVLRLLARGKKGPEISADRVTAKKTTEKERSNIFEKLGVHDAFHAITEARRIGILQKGEVGRERFDERLFYELSPEAIELLEAMYARGSDKDTPLRDPDLASALNTTPYEVKRRLNEIYRVLPIKDKLQVFTQYLHVKENGGLQDQDLIRQNEAIRKYHITSAERNVLALLAEGYSHKEVAETLVISPKTVEAHVANISNKLGTTGSAATGSYIAKAFEIGLLNQREIGQKVAEAAQAVSAKEHQYGPPPENLTQREEEVLTLKFGRVPPLTAGEVAEKLGLSPKTVEVHLSRSIQKLSAKNSNTAWLIYSAQQEAQKPAILQPQKPLPKAA